MGFNSIIGHKNHVEYIKKAIISKKLSHAFIFEGIDGIGKKLIARNLAKTLYCETQSDDSCGICRSCIKMNHDNHPDFMIIEPDGKSIKNAQIEAFQEFANIKPYDSNHKLVIINEADKMNASSQNRILKTLEEPPEHVIMIMVTNNSEALLPTVVSRCQIIKFNGLSNDEISKYLINNLDVSENESNVVARLSVGSLGRAIDYINSESFHEIKKNVIDMLMFINSNERSKVLGLLSYFTANKEIIIKILDYMILWYRDLMLYKKSKLKDLLIHIDEIDFIKKISRNLSVKNVIDNIELIEETKRKLNQHANYDLTIEVMLIKLLEV